MYVDLNNRKGQEQEWANAALKLHDLQTAMKNIIIIIIIIIIMNFTANIDNKT